MLTHAWTKEQIREDMEKTDYLKTFDILPLTILPTGGGVKKKSARLFVFCFGILFLSTELIFETKKLSSFNTRNIYFLIMF